MFKEGKKYTFEEIKKIYMNAEATAIENLNKSYKQATKDKDTDEAVAMAFLLQNVMAMSELYKCLFKGDNNDKN